MYIEFSILFFRVDESRRQRFDILFDRVFRFEENHTDTSVSRIDLEALEKEISIDIAELKREIRRLGRDLLSRLESRPAVLVGKLGRACSDVTMFSILSEGAGASQAIDEVPGEFSRQQQQGQEAQEMEQDDQSVKKRGFGQAAKEARRKKAFTLTSYKADNNPRAVEHMAKTLGLIGDSHRLQRRNTNDQQENHQEKVEKALQRASTLR